LYLHSDNRDVNLEAFRQGQEKAFDFFFKQYYTTICLFTFRITRNQDAAEEIAIDAFLKLWDRCDTFQTETGIRSFLYTVAHHAAIDWLRKEKTRENSLKQYSNQELLGENDAFKEQVAAETFTKLHEAISTLPPKCRRIFKMLFFDKKDYKEIATELNISINTVRAQKARAIGLLKTRLTLMLFFIWVGIYSL
jgi:RNA polymerase sigma-70 factor (family 1)